MTIESAFDALSNLNRDRNPKFWDNRTKGGAPHKPFLLLSILDGISEGWIDSNRIYPTQNLVDYFFGYWDSIIGTDKSTTVALPFYHMKSERFWELVYKPGKSVYNNSPSWRGIQDRIEYAIIDIELFELLSEENKRQEVRRLLLETYFGDATATTVARKSTEHQDTYSYSKRILSLAAEPFKKDHTYGSMTQVQKVTKQVRNQGFSKAIREIYGYTCSVCRDKIITPGGKILVEGAHIIPWSISSNDDPRNGLSLCPTHHWMFDNFMFTVRADYSIKTSKWLKSDKIQLNNLKLLENTELKLPIDSEFHPAIEALDFHFSEFDKTHKDWK